MCLEIELVVNGTAVSLKDFELQEKSNNLNNCNSKIRLYSSDSAEKNIQKIDEYINSDLKLSEIRIGRVRSAKRGYTGVYLRTNREGIFCEEFPIIVVKGEGERCKEFDDLRETLIPVCKFINANIEKIRAKYRSEKEKYAKEFVKQKINKTIEELKTETKAANDFIKALKGYKFTGSK